MTADEIGESAAVPSVDDDFEEEEIAAEIQDTDIVFDCPHCGHNLAIDYRGAGLQINCVNCGEAVLVPIPDGMNIDDLDIEPGEILKQLFATRRNLHKAELRVEDLEGRLTEQVERNELMTASVNALKTQFEELRQLCLQQETTQGRISGIVSRILEGDGEEDETEEGEPAAE